MTDPNTPADQTPPSYPPAASQPYESAPPAAYGTPAQATVPGKTLGIVAFILSFFVQLIALILGIVALVQSKKAGRGNGFALAAIIISAIGIIIGIIVFFALVLPSITAANTCIADPSAIVTIWGIQVPCSEVVTD